MIIDKIAVILVACIVLIFLAIMYVKKQAIENLVMISFLSFFIGLYIPFTYYEMYIPLYIHIPVLIFGVILPIIIVLLQYNNIMVSSKLLYRNAQKLYKKKKYDETIQELQKLINIEGKKSEYLYLLGKCYAEKNDYLNARDCFALAIDLNKEDYLSYYELGCVLESTEKTDSAIMMFNKALALKKDMYEAYEALGICLASKGRYQEAIKIYNEGIQNCENSCELYYNLAVLQMHLNLLEPALNNLKIAVSIDDTLEEAHYNIANIRYLKGEYDVALSEYKKVTKNTEYSEKAYYKIAMIYAIQKEYEKALTIIEYLIESDASYMERIGDEIIFNPMKEQINTLFLTRSKILQEEMEEKEYVSKNKKKSHKKKKFQEKIEEESQHEKEIKQEVIEKPNIFNKKLR